MLGFVSQEENTLKKKILLWAFISLIYLQRESKIKHTDVSHGALVVIAMFTSVNFLLQIRRAPARSSPARTASACRTGGSATARTTAETAATKATALVGLETHSLVLRDPVQHCLSRTRLRSGGRVRLRRRLLRDQALALRRRPRLSGCQ